jgi:hypothetical protein
MLGATVFSFSTIAGSKDDVFGSVHSVLTPKPGESGSLSEGVVFGLGVIVTTTSGCEGTWLSQPNKVETTAQPKRRRSCLFIAY